MFISYTNFDLDIISRAIMAIQSRGDVRSVVGPEGVLVQTVNGEILDKDFEAALTLELMDQALRRRIREETALERNLVLSLAFAQIQDLQANG